MRRLAMLVWCAGVVTAAASAAGDGGRIVVSKNDNLGSSRRCVWGDASYGGIRRYHYDVNNFRVWYVLDGPNALQDKSDLNNNGVPDMVEYIAADFKAAYDAFVAGKWYYHPDADEQKYLPLRDRYAALGWPEAGLDFGGDNRWDVYVGYTGGMTWLVYADQQFPYSVRDCYSAYFNVPNQYYPNTSAEMAAALWTSATSYMFDANETSGTDTSRWLSLGTEYWGVDFVRKPAVPGLKAFTSYFANTRLPFVAERPDVFLYFLNDWADRYWRPPAWKNFPDDLAVRDVWRATSRGDGWFTGEEGLNRDTEEAITYLIDDYDREHAFVDGRAFKDAFETFVVWNWFTGARDDGRHYKHGASYPLAPVHNVWTQYPIINYTPPANARVYYLGAAYYRFESLPSWPAAVLSFAADPGNAETTRDWGGFVLVNKTGEVWTDLEGKAGEASAMLTPGDKGIIQLRDPAAYNACVMILDNAAYKGSDLKFSYSFQLTNDVTPPKVSCGIVRPEANPGAVEILLGANETLFGAETDVYFLPAGEEDGTRVAVTMNPSAGGETLLGTYALGWGLTGKGIVRWRAADKAGNIVAGQKEFSAGWVTAAGGCVGDEVAAVRVPAGALRGPAVVTVVPRDGATAPYKKPEGGGFSPAQNLLTIYEIGPAWLRLGEPAEVVLSYEGLGEIATPAIFRLDGGKWAELPGVVDRRARRVVAITDRFGVFTVGAGSGKNVPPPATPFAFQLYQNYPNPADKETVVRFTLPAPAETTLAIYDLAGRLVRELRLGVLAAGAHNVRVALVDDAGGRIGAGVYVYRLTAGSEVAARRMVVR